MRHLKTFILIIAAIATALPATAQLRFGLKAGVGVNSLKATELDYVKENATGYSFGVMIDYTVPIIGIGVDASVMYARRNTPKNVSFGAPEGNTVVVNATMVDKNYLEVPVNLKYSLNLACIDRIVKPYIATGPSVAFNLSGSEAKEIDIKKANLSWNLGAGVELIRHIQLGFNYRWGLGSVAKDNLNFAGQSYDLNTNGWQISAAYLF